MNTEEYLTTLTQQIRCKAARDSVSEEIRQHIEDQIEAYLCLRHFPGRSGETGRCRHGGSD